MNKPTTTTETAIMYDWHDQNVTYVLNILESTAWTPMLEQLRNAYGTDRTARMNPNTAETVADIEAHLESIAPDIDELHRITNRIRINDEDRDEAQAELDELRADRDEARATAHDIEQEQKRILSDRADLVHQSALALAIWEREASATAYFTKSAEASAHIMTAVAGAEARRAEEAEAVAQATTSARDWFTKSARESARVFTAYSPDPGELEESARRRFCRAYIRAYIRAQRGQTALNTTRTDLHEAKAEDVRAWLASGRLYNTEATPAQYPHRAGTITLEWREADTKANRKAGNYWVVRRQTIRQSQSFEQYNEAGGVERYTTTHSAIVDNLASIEELQAVIASANLTKTQRELIRIYQTPEAIRAGEQERHRYMITAKRPTARGASEANATGRKWYTLRRLGYGVTKGEEAGQKAWERLIDRLTEAGHTYAQAKARGEAERRADHAHPIRAYWDNLHYWEHLAQSNRGNAPATTTPVDRLAWIDTTNTKTNGKPIAVIWHTAEQAERKRNHEAERVRQQAGESRIDNSTQEAQAKARANAEAWSKREAEARAEQDKRKAEAIAEAERLKVAKLSASDNEWSNWTMEQVRAHLAYIKAVKG